MGQLGNYHEAVCGRCEQFLYGTKTGDQIPMVVCPKCGAENFFSDSTGLSEARIRGTLKGETSHDSGHIHVGPNPAPDS
jgi:NAD-dependent SIR2 family protein deacetylase